MRRFNLTALRRAASWRGDQYLADVLVAGTQAHGVLKIDDDVYAGIVARYAQAVDPNVRAHLEKQYGGCRGCGQSRPDEAD